MSNGWQRSVIMLSSSAGFICRGKNVAYSPPQNSSPGSGSLRNPIEPIVPPSSSARGLNYRLRPAPATCLANFNWPVASPHARPDARAARCSVTLPRIKLGSLGQSLVDESLRFVGTNVVAFLYIFIDIYLFLFIFIYFFKEINLKCN